MSETRSDDETASSGEKRMRLRYAGACSICSASVLAGTTALYDRDTRTVRCVSCAPYATAPVEAGTAGASARREFERRHVAREERTRTEHPRLGGLILKLSADPQSTKAWATGAKGEEALGRRLDSLASPTVHVLHDRRIPHTRANIDHVVVCPSGVFVVDAKRYEGRPSLRVEGALFRERTEKLMVGSRDRTTLIGGVLKQVDLLTAAIGDDTVPVRAFLCFVDADWPLIGGSFTTRGVTVLWPRKLAGLIAEPGALSKEQITTIHRWLATKFPTA